VIRSILERMGYEPQQCSVSRVSGGDIHEAYRVESKDGPFFVKTNKSPLPDIFPKEARGLGALASACDAEGLISVAPVLAVDEDFLALGWIDGRPAPSPKAATRLGEGLAALHRHSSPTYGWVEDNWIGSLPQHNTPISADNGPGPFFASRLRAQAEIGARLLPTSLLLLIDRFQQRATEILPKTPDSPALLHGDLWGGNWMADSLGQPWIYDPATHHGCREAELAFTHLFGSFPPPFYEAYEAAFPLQPGHGDRVDLWNVYPLLVHANLFGGGYAARAEAQLKRFVG